jgi:hypothetical protein
MNKSSLLKPILLIAGASLLTTGCIYRREVYGTPPPPPGAVVVQPGAEVTVAEPPPPPIVESVTITPVPGYVWIDGAYLWQGRWVWEPGHWARPPRVGAVWIANRYELRGGRRVWVRGYWR